VHLVFTVDEVGENDNGPGGVCTLFVT